MHSGVTGDLANFSAVSRGLQLLRVQCKIY